MTIPARGVAVNEVKHTIIEAECYRLSIFDHFLDMPPEPACHDDLSNWDDVNGIGEGAA